MTLLYYDPACARHDTGEHPENARRVTTIWERLHTSDILKHCRRMQWEPARLADVERVHGRNYLTFLRRVCEQGGGRIEADTVVSSNSYGVARLGAGAVTDAVTRVLNDEDRRAFCLIRPPGHHAMPDQAMGFCLMNNVAVGARLATDGFGLDRVMIVDWDVHHGNGTQAMFWEDGRVAFLSIHRFPFYPGSGREDETGRGAAAGMIRNIPIAAGSSRKSYFDRFARGLEDLARRSRPDLVIVSAGFDAHRLDPIGALGLESEDFGELTRRVIDIACEYSAGRIVSVLEGGYAPDALAESVEVHLGELTTYRSNQPA